MPRSRASARAAGTRTERHVADWLAKHLDDDRIDRRVKTGAKDRGDIGGVRTAFGGRVVIEVKDTARQELGRWTAESEAERGNDDAVAAACVAKRRGTTDVGDYYVVMTGRDLVALLVGTRPE